MKNDVVNIKGTRQGLVIILDTTKNFAEVKQSLIAKITEKKGFFKGGKFTFDMTNGSLEDDQRFELEEVCRQFGLEYHPDIRTPEFRNLRAVTPKSVSHKAVSTLTELPTTSPKVGSTTATNSGEVIPLQGVVDKELEESGLLVQHSLRSGQKINYDGNVVILGDVNPGAEVITTGSIVVMGVLRGIAHAGASGNSSATITAYAIRPTQLRIADIIGIAPAEDAKKPTTIWPEKACVSAGQIVIDHCFNQRIRKSV